MSLVICEAKPDDLEAIVRLHEADCLGGHGDAWTEANRPAYQAAFAAIPQCPVSTLYAALEGGALVGTFQLTIAPGLVDHGARRAVLDAVQVRADRRSHGIGAAMVAFAESQARAQGARTLALSSNKTRVDAHRFYERLGYARSHEGFKKML